MIAQPDQVLRSLFDAAVRAALPQQCLAGHLPSAPADGRLAIIAAGKAALEMAQVACEHYGTRAEGLIVAPAGRPEAQIPGFEQVAAGHPVPDTGSVRGAGLALELAESMAEQDLLVVLLSGGASALLASPVPGVSLEQKQALTRALLSCGATIAEMNCVRRHLSRIKGGRLAAACRAPVETLAISDVAGDAPGTIGSGPTVQDPTNLAAAREVLARHGIRVPAAIRFALDDPDNESPDLGRRESSLAYRVVASGHTALQAAYDACRDLGVNPVDLGDRIEGDAGRVAAEHAATARNIAATRTGPFCLVSGGELTVQLGPGAGTGGPNSEYALALAVDLDGDERIWALAADTDGIDGHGGHAGALVSPGTLQRARELGLDPSDFLARHDSAGFFERVGGLLRPGPTGTNVNDFRAILVFPKAEKER